MRWHNTRQKMIEVSVLLLQEGLLEELRRYAVCSQPLEVCGFLVGEFDGLQAKANRLIYVKNVSPWPDRCVPDPKGCEAIFNAHATNELVAFFHSHTGSPEPSLTDKNNMRILPLVWLIAGQAQHRDPSRCECSAYKATRKAITSVDIQMV